MKHLGLLYVFAILHFNLFAVRPFITDDARVVGFKLFQWEGWLRSDPEGFQSWHMFAYGPHKRIELTLGGAFGADLGDEPQRFTGSAPLLQVKFLLNEYRPNKLPGVALTTGTFLPLGRGGATASGLWIFYLFGSNAKFLQK
jgi:hypothetical protein